MKRVGVTFSVVAAAMAMVGSGARAEQRSREDPSLAAAKQIMAKLRADPELADNPVQVNVAKGVATLKGTVDSESEKSRAVSLAAVPGVQVVDDQLKVGSADAKAVVTDSAVTTQVKTQFLANGTVRDADISVDTNNGVVTLSGTAPSEEARKLAVDMARNTKGVKRVEDKIKVLQTSTR